MKRTYRIHTKIEKIIFAQQMRKRPTRTEKIIWEIVRGKKLGFSIRRQHIILGYIVDFYCPAKRLAIELDGGVHKNQVEYDKKRDIAISSLGIKVLRFDNKQVLHDLGSVILKINNYLNL